MGFGVKCSEFGAHSAVGPRLVRFGCKGWDFRNPAYPMRRSPKTRA